MACQTCGQPTYYPLILSSTADGECIITEYPLSCDCNCPNVYYPTHRHLVPPPEVFAPLPLPPINTGMPHWPGNSPPGAGVGNSGSFGNLPSGNFVVTSVPDVGTLIGVGLYPGYNINSDGYYLQGGLSEKAVGVSSTSGIASIFASNDASIIHHVGPVEVITTSSNLSEFGRITLGLSGFNGISRPATTLTINASGIHAFTNKSHDGGGLANELFRVSTEDKAVYSYGPVTANKSVATKEYVDNHTGGGGGTGFGTASGVGDGGNPPVDVPSGTIVFYGSSLDVSAQKMESNGYKVNFSLMGDSIRTNHIQDNNITNNKISSLAITTSKLDDLAVTTDKLGASSVTDSKVYSGIDSLKIANGTVNNDKFQYLNTVTSNIQTQLAGKLSTAAGAVGNSNLADDSVDRSKIDLNVAGLGLRQAAGGEIDVRADGVFINFDDLNALTIIDESISTAKIATDAVTKIKIASDVAGIGLSQAVGGELNSTAVTIIDSKGDLAVGSAADTVSKLSVGLNDQVLMVSSGATYGIGWVYPTITTTLSFAASVALTQNASSVGLIDRISSVASLKVPTGKTLKVLSAWGSAYTGATTGAYTVDFLIYNKTGAVATTLATATGSSANSTIFGYGEGTQTAPLASITTGNEIQLVIKNSSATALTLGTVHDLFVVVCLV